MSKRSALAGINGALAGAVLVAAGVVGYAIWQNLGSAPDTTGPDGDLVEQAAVAPEATPDPAPEASTATPEAPDAAPPSIDEVRLEADGLTIIAGRAAPGSEVSVMLDGAKNTSVTTDPAGSFAAITILPPNPNAQVLTVVQRVGEDEISSLDEIILAPFVQPEGVADDAQTGDTIASVDPNKAENVVALTTEPQTPVAQDTTAGQEPVSETTTAATQSPQAASSQEPAAVSEGTAPAPDDGSAPAIAADAPQPVPTSPQVAGSDIAQTTVAEDPQSGQAVAVLKSTPEGVQVLNAGRPDVLENIEIDTISYSLTGDVQLSGRAQSEAEVVRVYVNNRPITDLDVDADGNWSGALPQIDTGVYTLRVDELDAGGQVTSRVETPFRREDPAVLAQGDAAAAATQITVQTGNTLWAIARDRYGEGLLYVEVFEANRDRIRNPDMIFPGQVFELPN